MTSSSNKKHAGECVKTIQTWVASFASDLFAGL
jgi:hypothetical protein